jgi:chemotaxis signal transduction protein
MMDQEQIRDESASEKATIRVILFELPGETWGIDFKDIQEVLEVKKTTPVPKTPSFILGVINQRGRIITVIDFALLLGEEENSDQGTRIVHLRSDKGNVGLLIRSKLMMDSLPEKLVETGKVVERSAIIPDVPLERRIVQKDKTEISLVDGEKIIALIERYPFKILRSS